jgi:hypothetical protein
MGDRFRRMDHSERLQKISEKDGPQDQDHPLVAIPPVDRSYTVTTSDDPNGSTGVYMRCESRNNYEDRCNNYAQGKY